MPAPSRRSSVTMVWPTLANSALTVAVASSVALTGTMKLMDDSTAMAVLGITINVCGTASSFLSQAMKPLSLTPAAKVLMVYRE